MGPTAGRWVAAGTLIPAAVIAASVALPWYEDWGKYTDPDDPSVMNFPADAQPTTGSGIAIMRQHDAAVELAPETDVFLVGGIPEIVVSFEGAKQGDPGHNITDWYTSFFGPGVTILLAAGLATVGVMAAIRRAGKTTLLTGLWIALVSWLAAAGTSLANTDSFELSGLGLDLWLSASVVAAAVLAVAVIQTRPGHVGIGVSWIGVACVVAFVPFVGLVSGLEERVPFAAGAVFVAYALTVVVPSTGVVLGLESVRSQPYSRAQRVPAVLTLVLGALLFGSLLFTLGS